MQNQISSDDTAMNIPIVTLTAAAAEQAKKLMGRAEDGVIGLRVGIKTAGCSGLQYQVEYATEQKPFEDRIVDKGVVILIDPAAVMFLIGSEMDWTEDKFSSSFPISKNNIPKFNTSLTKLERASIFLISDIFMFPHQIEHLLNINQRLTNFTINKSEKIKW